MPVRNRVSMRRIRVFASTARFPFPAAGLAAGFPADDLPGDSAAGAAAGKRHAISAAAKVARRDMALLRDSKVKKKRRRALQKGSRAPLFCGAFGT